MTATPLVAKTGIGFGDETLSTYDEGTWVPTVVPSGTGSITLLSKSGTYTRIGRCVNFNVSFTVFSVSSPTGNINISLPFPVGASGAVSGYGYLCLTGLSSIVGEVSAQILTVYRVIDGGLALDAATKLQASSQLSLSGFFFI